MNLSSLLVARPIAGVSLYRVLERQAPFPPPIEIPGCLDHCEPPPDPESGGSDVCPTVLHKYLHLVHNAECSLFLTFWTALFPSLHQAAYPPFLKSGRRSPPS